MCAQQATDQKLHPRGCGFRLVACWAHTVGISTPCRFEMPTRCAQQATDQKLHPRVEMPTMCAQQATDQELVPNGFEMPPCVPSN